MTTLPILSFILFLSGYSILGDKPVLVQVAQFDSREDCEMIREGLQNFPVKGYADQKLVCLESSEVHSFSK